MNTPTSRYFWGLIAIIGVVLFYATFPNLVNWGITALITTVLVFCAGHDLWYATKPTYYRPRWNSRSSDSPHKSRLSLILEATCLCLFAIALIRRTLGIRTTNSEMIWFLVAGVLISAVRWRDTGKWK